MVKKGGGLLMGAVERIPCGFVNCYLIRNGDAAVLVDVGLASSRDKLLNIMKENRVKTVFLTHGHSDHTQNAAYLVEHTGAKVAMNFLDVPLLATGGAADLQSRGVSGRLLRGATSMMGGQRSEIPSFTPDIDLRDGMSLEPFGLDGTVIGLPGHTKGSIGFLLRTGELIVGDALMNMFLPEPAYIFEDESLLWESARRIKALGDVQVFFGHGKPLANDKWHLAEKKNGSREEKE